MQIREFTAGDYAAVIDLWERCGLHPSVSDTPERLAGIARLHPGLFLLALEDDDLAGSVMGIWDGRRGWINRLAVDPARRHCGLARRLLALVEEALRARGCDKVNLLIEPDNAAVAGFYTAAGYASDPLIFMEKFL